jgi:hypothetical protein
MNSGLMDAIGQYFGASASNNLARYLGRYEQALVGQESRCHVRALCGTYQIGREIINLNYPDQAGVA